jgi:hypothetical protein
MLIANSYFATLNYSDTEQVETLPRQGFHELEKVAEYVREELDDIAEGNDIPSGFWIMDQNNPEWMQYMEIEEIPRAFILKPRV